jgi:UbiD family decarboxylase
MQFHDLRSWIDFLEEKGQLRRVKAEVCAEDGEMARLAAEVCTKKFHSPEGIPALLYENIKGYGEDAFCRRTFANNLATWERINWSLGLDGDTHPVKIVDHIRKTVNTNTIKPVIVSTGPCKENIVKGDDIDLLKLPVPLVSEWDGTPPGTGRYITTYGGWVTRDPDTGFINVGMYRGQMLDKHSIGVLMLRDAHWSIMHNKYLERGISKIPIAYFTGWDPAFLLITATAVTPYGVSEYDVMGGLRGKPIELVRCELHEDLLVPATAEIVLEGWHEMDPANFRLEGPFGEYTGHHAGRATPKPWVDIQCMTFRNDPIFQFMVRSKAPYPMEEEVRIHCLGMSAHYWNVCENAGIPGITGVYSPLSSCATNFRVQVKQSYQQMAAQIGATILAARPSWTAKHIFVYDTDIDICDDGQCDWAMAYRFDGADDYHSMKLPGSVLDPRTPPENRHPVRHGTGVWTGDVFDCTKPFTWEPREEWRGENYPPTIHTTPKLLEKIESRWDEYFPNKDV